MAVGAGCGDSRERFRARGLAQGGCGRCHNHKRRCGTAVREDVKGGPAPPGSSPRGGAVRPGAVPGGGRCSPQAGPSASSRTLAPGVSSCPHPAGCARARAPRPERGRPRGRNAAAPVPRLLPSPQSQLCSGRSRRPPAACCVPALPPAAPCRLLGSVPLCLSARQRSAPCSRTCSFDL